MNTVNTQITQMVMRGAVPDNAIKAIADRFKVSKSQAGRLVMTESAAFANEARKDCFKDLDVEKYVIVETLDGKTCDLCAQLDGKVYPMSEYAIGVQLRRFTSGAGAQQRRILTIWTISPSAGREPPRLARHTPCRAA